MVDSPLEPFFDFRDWFDGGNIFFRGKDKQRFYFALEAIIDRGLGLAVIGDNEFVLDHYYRMLLAKLRQNPDFDVEILLPANTENLLERFNGLVEEMTIDEARHPAGDKVPAKLLIINDAKLVEMSQWTLLERLLSDFPGINARVILFIDRTYNSSYEDALSVFGRKLHRWVSETPSSEETRLLLEAADEHGFSLEARDLMKKAGIAISDQEAYLTVPEEIQDDFDNSVGRAEDPILQDRVSRDSALKNMALMLLIASMFFLLGLFVLDFSGLGDKIKTGITVLNLSSGSVGDLEIDPANPEESGITDTENAEISQNDHVNSPHRAVIMPNRKNLALSESAQEGASPIGEKLGDNWVDEQSERPADEQLIFNSKPESYFVQHVVLSSRNSVIEFANQYPKFGPYLVLALNKNKSKFALISGPYDSKLEANLSIESRNLPDTFWIRPASELQTSLDQQ